MLLEIAHRFIKAAFWLCVAFVALLFSWHLLQICGPRSEVPPNPVEARNALADSLAQNAAPLYEQAYAALTPFEPPAEGTEDLDDDEDTKTDDWQSYVYTRTWHKGPLPPNVIAWLDANTEAVELVRQAGRLPNCAFRAQFEAESPTLCETPFVRRCWRNLNKFLQLQMRLALERGDSNAFAEYTVMADRMTRHAEQHPPNLIAYLVGVANSVMLGEALLEPFDRLPHDQLKSYPNLVRSTCAPHDPPDKALKAERDAWMWFVTSSIEEEAFDVPAVGFVSRWIITPERIIGEYDRLMAPAYPAVRAPLETFYIPGNELLQRLIDMHAGLYEESLISSVVNVPRYFVRTSCPSIRRLIELRVLQHCQLRANDIALSIFEYEMANGVYPELLDQLGRELPLDPVSRQPYQYRRTDDGFTLYSLGLDGDDDGGTHDRRYGRSRTDDEPDDGDFVFWPLQRR